MNQYSNIPENLVLYDPDATVLRARRRTTKIHFTDEQRQWMKDNFHDTTNQECAEHLGVSLRTMIRLAREMGLEKDSEFCHEMTMKNCRLMQRLNKGEGNSGKKNLLKYGVAYRFQKGISNVERHGEEKEAKRLYKAHASRCETIRKERMRVNWGLPQQTKLKIGHNKHHAYIRHSLRKRGYILPLRGGYVAYFDTGTRRGTGIEQTANENGFTILDYGNHQQ